MAQKRENLEVAAALEEVTEDLIEVLDKYGVTPEDLDEALEIGARNTLLKMYPELVKQAA
jgi:uncharacterized protein YutE (UPF0331/DUF86 family)